MNSIKEFDTDNDLVLPNFENSNTKEEEKEQITESP